MPRVDYIRVVPPIMTMTRRRRHRFGPNRIMVRRSYVMAGEHLGTNRLTDEQVERLRGMM